MQNKPLIGINADYRAAKGDSPAFTCLPAGYFDCVSHVGGIPVVIPPLANEDDIGVLYRVETRKSYERSMFLAC